MTHSRSYFFGGTPVLFEFSVAPPWYRVPAFLFIITSSTAVILILLVVSISRHFRLRRAYGDLEMANEELLELDKMKSQFVSQASHDLRTPLTAIKGSLDNLLMGIAGDLNEKQSKIMERATKSVDRLTNLINDVLDLNRIETGRIVLEKTDIPFKALIFLALLKNLWVRKKDD